MSLPAIEKRTVELKKDEYLGADADDAVLCRQAMEGEVWAQREIWFRFAPMVYGLFRRALGSGHDHEDLAQEVFLRVFRKLHTLEEAGSIRSFVFSVAVRVVSEEVRRFAWRRRIMERRPAPPTPATSSPADFEIRETMLCIQRSLDGMCDKHRAVFVLRYVEGMDLGEIAVALGISRATVKRHLARVMASVQKSIWQADGHVRVGVKRPFRLFGGGR
jgi:RNA polymerase sigma-70 factor (ECF subfamily)